MTIQYYRATNTPYKHLYFTLTPDDCHIIVKLFDTTLGQIHIAYLDQDRGFGPKDTLEHRASQVIDFFQLVPIGRLEFLVATGQVS